MRQTQATQNRSGFTRVGSIPTSGTTEGGVERRPLCLHRGGLPKETDCAIIMAEYV